ncbi:MAG: glycosyl transferase [Deltaproteobacteria bacterium]|nr:glycosyl transferase [Deltaproteobacteria bacterium]MBW2121808.1 glycosyl transferase [Deltaproteobacteria bacterium]
MVEIGEENPGKVRTAEIIVAIPSYDEAEPIRLSTRTASEGLTRFYPDRPSVIIHYDDSPTEFRRDAFLAVDTEVPKIYLPSPEGAGGRGEHLRSLFMKAVDLKARAVIVVEADLESMTPRWISNLADPLFRDFGFVAPLYDRHRFEEAMTHIIAYPLTRTLYGRRVRHPLGGEFGFSGNLARIFLQNGTWEDLVSPPAVDIWMITLATNHRVHICQSLIHRRDPEKPGKETGDPGPLFDQVVRAIFTLMERYADYWKRVKWSRPTAVFGVPSDGRESSLGMTIDKKRFYERFIEGTGGSIDRLRAVLSAEVFSKLMEVAGIGLGRFDFPTELWAKILFDFAVAFHKDNNDGGGLLDSLRPLYYGRLLGFFNDIEKMSTRRAEQYVEEQCLIFEETKPYLIRRWADG